MAGELQSPVSVTYVQILNPSGLIWNTGTSAFEAGTAANVGNYAVAMTQQSTLDLWLGNFPTGITTAGLYTYLGYLQSGSSPATKDALQGVGTIHWDGAKVVSTLAVLTANGLDGIAVETGVNARQALSPILAAAAGQASGLGSGSVVIKAAGNPSTTRISATTDTLGNRTAVTLNLPS